MARARGTGSLYMQKGSSVWWCKYYRCGKPYRESTRTQDKKQAAQFLKQRLAEITTGNFYGPQAERTRVQELAEDFIREYRINGRKSLEWAERRWKRHLEPFFGHLRAVNVTSDLIARYVDTRQQNGAMNATINRDLSALKRMFRLGQQATPPKVNRVPRFPKLAENNVRTGFLDEAQYQKLFGCCSEMWLRTLIEVAYRYGWRKSELLNMRVGQVDLLARCIRLNPGETKNREGRVVTMTATIHALLSQCVQGKTAEAYVFTRTDGKRVRNFRKAWANLCETAGIPGLLLHDMRRTAARNLRRAGVAEGIIMKIGGWKTRSIFERYAIVTEADIAEAIEKLERTPKSQPEPMGGRDSTVPVN